MNFLTYFFKKFDSNRQQQISTLIIDKPEPIVESDPEPFVEFPCYECKQTIKLMDRIYPGQAAVIQCQNCSTSMTVYCPQLIIKRTKDLPQDLSDVWKKLSE